MKKITALIILVLAAVIFAASASAQTLTVTSSYANCRSRAGASNVYLGKVYKGQTYEIIGNAKAPNGKLWYKIKANGKDCYICSSFVRVNAESKPKTSNNVQNKRLLGTYYITGYCRKCNGVNGCWRLQTASGKTATAGRTVAMKGLPFGTRIYIDGIGERIVEDRGVGSGVVDVFCSSHGQEYGITGHRKVWILE